MIGEGPALHNGLPSYRPGQVEMTAPCMVGCATGGNVRGWLSVIAQRHRLGIEPEEAYRQAWEILVETNPFPATMGRVCPHPCESTCTRADKDGAVSINALERFLGDWAIAGDARLPWLTSASSNRSCGVVGGGPAGLSFAFQMARRGHQVTIYERKEKLGGMLRYGIPDYRLPPDVLDAEIDRIIALGVEVRTGVAVGRDVTLEELKDAHDVLFTAPGAPVAVGLGIEGEGAHGVHSGIEFLAAIAEGRPVRLGSRVSVIGGGNTAIDAARTARRLGAEVTVHYRRTRAEMPAIESEIDDAEAEGVTFAFLQAPVAILTGNEAVRGIRLQHMRLGDPDPSGRRRPIPAKEPDTEIEADSVIVAVAQVADTTMYPRGRALPICGRPAEISNGVWVGGDVVEPAIAGAAVLHGRTAAEAAHRHLTGAPDSYPRSAPPVQPKDVDLEHLQHREPPVLRRVSPAAALASPGLEISIGLDEAEFLEEAARCFSCGLCHGCAQCFMYCTAGAISPAALVSPGTYFDLDLSLCTECGKCIELCPTGYLAASTLGTPIEV